MMLFLFILISCSNKHHNDINASLIGDTVSIKGRTAVFDDHNNIIHFRIDSSWREIELKGCKDKEYSGLILCNTTDTFLVVEYSKNEFGRTVEGDIIEFNMSGDSLNKVFDSKTGELVGNLCLSRNDNKLLFTLKNDNFNPSDSDPMSQLNRPLNILIFDFKKREIIRKLDTVGMEMNVWINDAPWLSDESRFIYDFRTDRKIKMYNDTSEERLTRQAGIYLYNIELDNHSLLIPDGKSGVVSPVEDKIAYLMDKGVYIYNVNTKSSELLYKLSNKEKTAYIVWTPNGEFIYFRTYMIDNSASNENLIRVYDKQKMKITGISGLDKY